MYRMFCPDCGEFMRVKINGVKVRPKGYYGYFMADIWYCPRCGKEVMLLAVDEIVSDEPVDYDYSGDRL